MRRGNTSVLVVEYLNLGLAKYGTGRMLAVVVEQRTGDARRESPRCEKPAAGTVEARPDHLLRLATYSSTRKQEPVRENRACLTTRSNAAATAGASALQPNCAMGSLPCRK